MKSTKSTQNPKRKRTAEEIAAAKQRQIKKEGLPTNEEIEQALRNTFGRISVAARLLNFDRTTIYQRIGKHPKLKRVVQESRALVVPYAETKLFQNVASGDQRAIEFVLKNKGKGWNVNGEQETGTNDLNYVINIFQKSLEEMRPPLNVPPEPTIIDVKTNGDTEV